jgi:hypothetical protein
VNLRSKETLGSSLGGVEPPSEVIDQRLIQARLGVPSISSFFFMSMSIYSYVCNICELITLHGRRFELKAMVQQRKRVIQNSVRCTIDEHYHGKCDIVIGEPGRHVKLQAASPFRCSQSHNFDTLSITEARSTFMI